MINNVETWDYAVEKRNGVCKKNKSFERVEKQVKNKYRTKLDRLVKTVIKEGDNEKGDYLIKNEIDKSHPVGDRKLPHHLGLILQVLVLNRDGFKCYYSNCNEPGITLDHRIPIHNKGKWELVNLLAYCKHHNSSKGIKSVEDFEK